MAKGKNQYNRGQQTKKSFGGQLFDFLGGFGTKTEATRAAKQARGQGFGARTARLRGIKGWGVWGK